MRTVCDRGERSIKRQGIPTQLELRRGYPVDFFFDMGLGGRLAIAGSILGAAAAFLVFANLFVVWLWAIGLVLLCLSFLG